MPEQEGENSPSYTARLLARVKGWFPKATNREVARPTPEPIKKFPENHHLAWMNPIADLPPDGQQLVIEWLACTKSVLSHHDFGSPQTEELIKTLSNSLARSLEEHVNPSVIHQDRTGDNIDPGSRASFYRDFFTRLVTPLKPGQIYLGLKAVRPSNDFLPEWSYEGMGLPSMHPFYKVKLSNIDLTKI